MRKRKVRNVIGVLILLAGIIGGLYVGGWVLFIKPIIDACKAFDAGTLTALTVGITIIKCVFASAVGSVIAYLGVIIGKVVAA